MEKRRGVEGKGSLCSLLSLEALSGHYLCISRELEEDAERKMNALSSSFPNSETGPSLLPVKLPFLAPSTAPLLSLTTV